MDVSGEVNSGRVHFRRHLFCATAPLAAGFTWSTATSSDPIAVVHRIVQTETQKVTPFRRNGNLVLLRQTVLQQISWY